MKFLVFTRFAGEDVYTFPPPCGRPLLHCPPSRAIVLHYLTSLLSMCTTHSIRLSTNLLIRYFSMHAFSLKSSIFPRATLHSCNSPHPFLVEQTFQAIPHDNDFVDDATSTMEFTDCNVIVEGSMSSFDDIVEFRRRRSLRKSLSCGVAFNAEFRDSP